MIADLSDLLSAVRRDRLRAIRELAITDALPYALRRVVFTDLDAHVRGAAARRLGALADPQGPFAGARDDVEGWLLDALADRSPMVRDTILRAIARCGSPASAPALRALIAHDRIWWIRRAAIYTLAAVAGTAEVGTFTRALGDPFWRVRQAAVRVLAVLGVRDPDVRSDVLEDAPASSTLTYLRSTWGPAPLDGVREGAVVASALPPILRDPDPAVVTARLPTDPDVTPHAIVELLCDPHTPLRIAASERLVASGDLDAIESALDWLEEPRIPHVVDTVEYLVDHLGDPAGELAVRALARTDRPGAGRWAIEWVVTTHAESLYGAALERARRGDATLRLPAISLATDDDLVAWAAEVSSVEDGSFVDAIAAELHERRAFAELARIDGATRPRVRALQVDAIARQHRRDPAHPAWTAVDAALADPHHGPRAIAARWLVRTDRVDPERLARDVDPGVREAALVPATAALATSDPDPWVARAAMRTLLAAHRDAYAHPETLPASAVTAVLHAFDAIDPWVRQQACRMPLGDPRLLAAVVDHLDDRDDMVRAAAHDALEQLPEADTRVRALLERTHAPLRPDEAERPALDRLRTPFGSAARPGEAGPCDRLRTPFGSAARPGEAGPCDRDLPGPTRVMAYSWLVRRLDDAAVELARTAYERETDRRVRALLAQIAGLSGTPVAAETEADRVRAIAQLAGLAGGDHMDAAQAEARPETAGATGTSTADADGARTHFDMAADAASTPDADRARARITIGAPTVDAERAAAHVPERAKAAVERRPFGRAGFTVAPLAISGAYDVPVRVLETAHGAGVDLFFWEPGYDRLGRFVRERPRSTKILTGTYHGDPRSIRLDVERALRTLRRDTLDGFLLFWTRSPNRLDPASLDALQRLRAEGKVRAIGFSTHIRSIAAAAIATGHWDVVMTRHSAAHTGIETEVLPAARATNTAIVTFSALTYGRMLSGATPGVTLPTAAECYRYSLAQAGVTACISAPRHRDELVENLEALATPTLPADRIAELRAHGAGVRAESQRFNTLLRQPTRDAAAAAREMLAGEPAPSETSQPRRLPEPHDFRRSRTRLGVGRRR